MRDIWEENGEIITRPKKAGGKIIIWELDSHLLEQCQNLINGQKFPKLVYFLGNFIKQAIETYINKKFTLTISRQPNNPKRQIGVHFPTHLTEYYQTIPSGQRKEFIELVLINYLDGIKKGKKL